MVFVFLYVLGPKILFRVPVCVNILEAAMKSFVSRHVDGLYVPVSNNIVQAANRACLFQHLFDGRFYGFQSHLTDVHGWEMELIREQLPR
jgi:hypothetical protein